MKLVLAVCCLVTSAACLVTSVTGALVGNGGYNRGHAAGSVVQQQLHRPHGNDRYSTAYSTAGVRNHMSTIYK